MTLILTDFDEVNNLLTVFHQASLLLRKGENTDNSEQSNQLCQGSEPWQSEQRPNTTLPGFESLAALPDKEN